MDVIVYVIASVLGVLCGTFTVLLVVYLVFWRKRALHKAGLYKVYQTLPDSFQTDQSCQEKMHIIQPPPEVDTVPFLVPGSVSARGWGPEASPRNSSYDMEALLKMGEEENSRFTRVVKAKEASSLGSVDPNLYKPGEEEDDYEMEDNHIGRLWFSVEYDQESEKLIVSLIKARNLPSRSFGSANICDPVVRLFLLPDERRYLQSKIKKKTCNPKFNEDFIFQVPQRTFAERVLKLTMYDVDRHKRHRVVGHATYPLRPHGQDSGDKVIIWRDLERDIPETTLDRGDIMVSLSYNNHYERLNVGVYEGRNFKRIDEKFPPDFYLRVSLLLQSRVTKTKKTATVRDTVNPIFNESFNFKLLQNQLDSCSVSISAMQLGSGTRDKSSGRIVLGSFMFCRGKELDHWNEMAANPREHISHWHSLT